MISESHKVFIAFGLAIAIIKRNQGGAEVTEKTFYSRKNVQSPYSARSYEDEIKDVSKCLSETGVQLNFPRALEILLDFALFDIDEGLSESTTTPSVLINGLKKLCFEEDYVRIELFSEHLSKRLFQRTVGRSDAMYDRGETVASMMCGANGRSRGSKAAPSHQFHSNEDDSCPPLYARWVLESINRVIIKVADSGLDIMRNPFGDLRLMHDYKIYERLIALSGILKEGILLLVRHDGTHTNYRGREYQEHSLRNSVSSPDVMRTPKKSRNLSFTQYNTQYEEQEQEKKKQRRNEEYSNNNSYQRQNSNDHNNNNRNNNNSNNNRNDGNMCSFDRNISVSRGSSNISGKNHGSHTDCDQNDISTMPRNTNISRFRSDTDDKSRIASSNGVGNGDGNSVGGVSFHATGEGNKGERSRERDREGERDKEGGREGERDGGGERDREGDGSVEIWAMSLIAQAYDKIEGLPQVKSTYQQIVDTIEFENMNRNQY